MPVRMKTGHIGSEEWIQLRKTGIGGSDVAAVAGVSRWKCPFQVYLEKTGEFDFDPETEPIYWGKKLEDIVAKEFTLRSGKKVRRNLAILRSEKHPFMIADIDREVVGENAGLECKTTSVWNRNDWQEEKVPDEYMLQCQHYMEVMGWDYMYLAVLIGGQEFKWMRVDRNKDLIGLLVSIERDFWDRVLRKDPPPVDGSRSAVEIINYLYPDAKDDGPVMLEINALEWIEKYMNASEAEKAAKAQKDEAANQLKLMLKESQEGRVSNYSVFWKSVASKRLDTDSLKEKYSDIYKELIRETQYRKFYIKEVV